jgi:hypothetical protein
MCSSVILGRTFSASRFCSSCGTEVTPRMIVEVFGFLASHARASAVGVEPMPIGSRENEIN